MLNRLFGVLVVVVWLIGMTGLVVRDLWPAWTAREPPPTPSRELLERIDRNQQFGILRSSGARLGTSWTTLTATPGTLSLPGGVRIQNTTLIEPTLGLPGPVWVDLQMELLADGTLDNFNFDILGTGRRIHAEGEAYGSKLACTFQVGLARKTFTLEATNTRLIGEKLHLFSCLPELEVGQAWRMQVIDPWAAIRSHRLEPRAILAQVVGRESVQTGNGTAEAFVVQTEGVRAWVDRDGLVVKQEVDIPLLGRLSIRRETFDEHKRREALERVQWADRSAE